MKLYEQEQVVKDLIKNDRNNPEIYLKLQQMIYMFLRRKKIGNSPKEVEEVSYTMAGDLFLKIIEGEEISNFFGLLDKEHRKYFTEYYEREKYIEPYDITMDPRILNESSFENDFAKVNNKIYLEDINKVINEVMDKSCKYKPWTVEYNNLKVSLALSILRRKKVNFHLNLECEYYLNILIASFYNEVKKTSHLNFGDD